MANENVSMTQRQAPSLDQPQTPEVMTVMPPVDIYENQDEILLVADFPGVPKESLSVRLDRSELLIEGTQALPQEQPHIQPLAFSRAFRVPNTVDPNRISAELKHGVLQVRLAKSEAAKPRRIEVRST
jgi:HSP20 family molecular chaperone IbpA